jgi:hypothetical protein
VRADFETTRHAWSFLTNHLQVLLCIARDPNIRLRDIAALVGITERAAQNIVADLVDDGYVLRTRVGRRNEYEVNGDLSLRHPNSGAVTVGGLLEVLEPSADDDLADSERAHAGGVAGGQNGNANHLASADKRIPAAHLNVAYRR